jgi:hypothetical protein
MYVLHYHLLPIALMTRINRIILITLRPQHMVQFQLARDLVEQRHGLIVLLAGLRPIPLVCVVFCARVSCFKTPSVESPLTIQQLDRR